MKHTFRWNRVLTAIGVKGGDFPELERQWIPTIAVGDARELSPPLFGPCCWIGGELPAIAGNYGGLLIQPNTDGGLTIDHLYICAPPAATYRACFQILDAEPAHGAGTVMPKQEMGPRDTSCVCTLTTTVLGMPTNPPTFNIGNSQKHIWGRLHIPSGKWFWLRISTANQLMYVSLMLREHEEALGSA